MDKCLRCKAEVAQPFFEKFNGLCPDCIWRELYDYRSLVSELRHDDQRTAKLPYPLSQKLKIVFDRYFATCCCLCVSVSLWLLLTATSAQARPIIGLSTDAPAILHRGDVFTATVYLVNGKGPPAANLIGVDWSLPYPAVFHVLSRTLDDSPFTDPLALDPTPGGVDLGGTVPDVTIPAPPGFWTLAALRIQVDASAPYGPYTLTTLSPDGAGAVTADFTDHPFTLHTAWPLEIADSQILRSQISNSEIQAPEPASALLLALILLVIEFGLGPRRER